MKLIEKKCPNCSATLKFKPGDKEAKCEFCKSEFVIEHNEEKKDISEIDIDSIDLTEKIAKTFGIIHLAIVAIVMIVFIVIFINTSSMFKKEINNNNNINNNNDYNEIKDEINEQIENITKEVEIEISELDETVKEDLSNAAIREANKWGITTQYKLQGEREVVGFYYMKNNFFKGVKIYSVIKSTYSNGNDTKTLYSSFVFRGDDLDSLSYSPTIGSDQYELSTYEVAYGYESVKELYNADVRGEKSSNKIVATEDLYID